MFKAVKQVFRSLDIFGQPIQLSINRKYLQKSGFGAFMTLSLITTFVIIVFQGFIDLINHENLTTFSETVYYTSPPSINFSTKKLYFALSFNDIRLNDPRYFDLNFYQGLETINSEGKKNYDFKELVTEPCTNKHFPDDLLENLLKKNPNISSFICPPLDFEINVQGAYSSETFTYFWIKLDKCQPKANKTCMNDEEIDIIFNELQRVYLNIFFSNNIIKGNEFSNPVSPFLDDRIYVLLDRSVYKEKNYFFMANKIFTDSSVLTTQYQEEINTYTYENVNDETIIKHSNSNNSTYAGIFFRSYLLGQKHVRTFTKLGRFMGYIGGFWSLLYLVFSVVAKNYNRFKLLVKMANNFYTFPNAQSKQTPNEIKNTSKKRTFHNLPESAKSNNKIASSIISNSKDNFQKNFINNPMDFEKKIRNYIKTKKSLKLPHHFIAFLKAKLIDCFGLVLKFFKRFSLDKIDEFREKAYLAIQKDTDIIYLLTKNKEIDKMKDIIFNEFQRQIFEFFTKKQIESFDKFSSRSTLVFLRKSRSSILPKKNQFNPNYFDLFQLYKAFAWLKESNKNQNSEDFHLNLNEKILKSFDKDLLALFQEEFNITNTKSRNLQALRFDKKKEKLI